ncbi:MAG: serine--tRNA ligase [Candidatus Woesearchaeota archaeon]
MLDVKFIRENPEIVKKNMKKKFQDTAPVDRLLELDNKRLELMKESQSLRHSRNDLSKSISEAKKSKDEEKAQRLKEEAKAIPDKISGIEAELKKVKEEENGILVTIPNIMHESVPIGKDDSENVEIKRWGEPRKFDFKVRNHVEILEGLGIADFDMSSKTTGNGFYFLKGDLALLNQAMIQFVINFMREKGYTYVEPPLMLRKKVLDAAMDTESFKDTIYSIEGEDLHLIGTSEYSLLGMHSDQVLRQKDLPKKYFSYSMCFRKEIGSHGINEKGLWRTHQFNKVEQFIFCSPEESYQYYDELLQNSEEVFQQLGLPYRVIECCSGDLATWKAKSCDMEVWRPTTESYGEVTSLTNCTDFQARGLGIRVEKDDGSREVLHTLNNTAIATSRALVGLIENYQEADGSITIPEVLRPYMGKDRITKD